MPEHDRTRVRTRLDALRREFDDLKHKAAQAESNLELEYYTLLEELQIDLESAEQKFELLLDTHEDQWQRFGNEVEEIWRAARELVRAINSP